MQQSLQPGEDATQIVADSGEDDGPGLLSAGSLGFIREARGLADHQRPACWLALAWMSGRDAASLGKPIKQQWSKREAQILAVVGSTVGMVGDLQGIAGKAMPEIPSLDMPLLEASTDRETKVSLIGKRRGESTRLRDVPLPPRCSPIFRHRSYPASLSVTSAASSRISARPDRAGPRHDRAPCTSPSAARIGLDRRGSRREW